MNEQEAISLVDQYQNKQTERNLEEIKPYYMSYDHWKEFNDRLICEVQPDVKLSLIFTNLETKEHTFFHNFEGRLCDQYKEEINNYFDKCQKKEYMFNNSVMAIIFDTTKVPVFEKLKSDYIIQDLRNK